MATGEASRGRDGGPWRGLAPLLLVALVVLLHWPGGAGFKADDYPAIRYASEVGHCVHDFGGAQYGISFFLFYRPLITASFAVDRLLFGVEPFGYYAMNAAALAAAALLLHAILRMLRPDRAGGVFAFAAVVLWVANPVLVPSLRWVAGRVDTHVAVPVLAALWLHLRLRRGGRRWPVLVAALAALATKESAVGLPLLALGLDLLDPHPSYRPAPSLFGRALPALPYLGLIPAYLGLRWVVLGNALGGYGFLAGETLAPLRVLEGVGLALSASIAPRLATMVPGLLVSAATLWWALRAPGRRGARLAGVLLVAGGLFGPLAQVLTAIRGDQRHAYLACAGVVAVWAGVATLAAGRRPVLGLVLGLAPLAWVLPAQRAARAVMDGHDRFDRALVRAIADCDGRLAPAVPVVLGGEAERANDPYRFLWGLGAVRKPPFAPRPREVVTLRPFHPRCTAVPATLVTRGLGPWVLVDAGGGRVVAADTAPPQALAERADFDGRLDSGDLGRVFVAPERFGFRLGDGFDGRVAVCTSVGSCVVEPARGGGVLSLPALLGANVTPRVQGPVLPLLYVVWNAMDLAPDSPIFLFWRERRGVVRASFRAGAGFTAAVRRALGR